MRLMLAGAVVVSTGCVDGPDDAKPGATSALDVCALSVDGALCDDNQPCTVNDVCLNKRCVGTSVVDGTACTDGNVCTGGDQCINARCVGTLLADGTPCTDGDACTEVDVCQAGRCQPGTPTICDDGDACTVDMCMPDVGCVFSARDCGVPPDSGLGVDAQADAVPDAEPADAVDATPDSVESDSGLPDAQGMDGGGQGPDANDAGVDAEAADAAADAVDAGVDAGPGPVDARDAGVDLMETPPDLRARGGGCNCALAGASGGNGSLPTALTLLAVAPFVVTPFVSRRRKPRAKRG